MRLSHILLPALVLGVLVLAPLSAEAANASFFGPIITERCHCDEAGEIGPDWGCVLDAAHNTFNLLFSLSVLVFAFAASYAGILFMTSAAQVENRSRAKAMLLNVVIGLLISLSAWLLVDFVMRILYDEGAGWGPWNSILADGDSKRCLTVRPPGELGVDITPGGVGVDVTDGFAEGDTVLCYLTDPDTLWPGSVTGVSEDRDTLTVQFDEEEADVPASHCQPAEEVNEECPDLEPSVTIGPNATVSSGAEETLKEIMKVACVPSATITSGRRTVADQARIMYDLIESRGVSYVKNLYGAGGDSVVDAYSAAKSQGKTAAQIKSAMEAQIVEVGPENVSNHISDRDVFDVAPSSVNDDEAFKDAVRRAKDNGKVRHYIFPPQDPAFHIEL